MTNEELVIQIQEGKNVSGNMVQLYQQNRGMICKAAKPYCAVAEMEDLIQEAYIALDKAVKKFDTSAGYKFSTYFMTALDRHYKRYCDKQSPVTMTHGFNNTGRLYSRTKEEIMQQTGGEINDGCMMALMEMKPKAFNDFMKALNCIQCVSLDAQTTDDDNESATLYNLFRDDSDFTEELIESAERKRLYKKLWKAYWKDLTHRQQQVLYYTVVRGKTGNETAELLNVSRQAVSASKKTALNKLLKCEKLKSLAKEFDYGCAAAFSGGVGRFNNSGYSSVEAVALKHLEIEEQAASASAIYTAILQVI